MPPAELLTEAGDRLPRQGAPSRATRCLEPRQGERIEMAEALVQLDQAQGRGSRPARREGEMTQLVIARSDPRLRASALIALPWRGT
jgi:hypothetical protein